MERHWLRKHKEVDLAPPHCLREGETPKKPKTNEYLVYVQGDEAVDYNDDTVTEQEEAIDDDTKVEYWQHIYRKLNDDYWDLGEKKRDMNEALQVKHRALEELTKKLEVQVLYSNKLNARVNFAEDKNNLLL